MSASLFEQADLEHTTIVEDLKLTTAIESGR